VKKHGVLGAADAKAWGGITSRTDKVLDALRSVFPNIDNNFIDDSTNNNQNSANGKNKTHSHENLNNKINYNNTPLSSDTGCITQKQQRLKFDGNPVILFCLVSKYDNI